MKKILQIQKLKYAFTKQKSHSLLCKFWFTYLFVCFAHKAIHIIRIMITKYWKGVIFIVIAKIRKNQNLFYLILFFWFLISEYLQMRVRVMFVMTLPKHISLLILIFDLIDLQWNMEIETWISLKSKVEIFSLTSYERKTNLSTIVSVLFTLNTIYKPNDYSKTVDILTING